MNLNTAASTYLVEQIESLKTEIQNSSKKLKINQVHNLRVSLHRIRSLLQLSSLRPGYLKKLDQALGKVRDLDVAIANAKIYGIEYSTLKRKRKKMSRRVTERFHAHNKKILKKLTATTKEFKKSLNPAAHVRKLLASLRQYEHELSDKELHEVRKKLKKVRYLLEAAGKPVDELKAIQDQLGEVHDLQVLSEYYKHHPQLKNERMKKNLCAKKSLKPALKLAAHQLDQLT